MACPMNNFEVLSETLSYLSLADLKSARLVCKFWAYAGGKSFSEKVLVAHEPISLANLEDVATFLAKHHIKHVLKISFLAKYPWYFDREYYCSGDYHDLIIDYGTQQNCTIYVDYLFKSMLRSVGTLSVITEMYLELMLMTAEDGLLLIGALSLTKFLRKLAIVFVDSTNEAVQSLPQNFSLPPTFQSLGFKVLVKHDKITLGEMVGPAYPGQWTQKSYAHFFTVFGQRLQFLDCMSYPLLHGCFETLVDKMELCVEALDKMCSDSGLILPNLEGLRIHLSSFILLKPFKPLRYLSLTMFSHNEASGNVYNNFLRETLVDETLSSFARTLKICELYLYPYKDNIQRNNEMPKMPVLEDLSIVLRSAFDENSVRTRDVMSLRSLFLGGSERFAALLPSLKSLTIISVPFVTEVDEFSEIFLLKDENNLRTEICQLEYLVISMTTGCQSAELTKIMIMFPKLKILRHLKQVNSEFQICDHYRRNGSLVTVGLVGNFIQKEPLLQNSFHLLRLQKHPFPFFYSYIKPDDLQLDCND